MIALKIENPSDEQREACHQFVRLYKLPRKLVRGTQMHVAKGDTLFVQYNEEKIYLCAHSPLRTSQLAALIVELVQLVPPLAKAVS